MVVRMKQRTIKHRETEFATIIVLAIMICSIAFLIWEGFPHD